MKILFVSCSVRPLHQSGVATWIEDMADALKGRGHDIYVFTMDAADIPALFDERNITHSSYHLRVVTIANTYERLINFFKQNNYLNHSLETVFVSYLKQVQPDIVHFHSVQGMGVNLFRAAKEYGANTVYSVHDCWWFCPYLFMSDMEGIACQQRQISCEVCESCVEKVGNLPETSELTHFNPRVFLTLRSLTIRNAIENYIDLVLPVSKFIGSFFEANNIQPQRLEVFENGVKVGSCIKKELTEDRTELRFGFVGGHNLQKGFGVLMEAIVSLRSSRAHFYIYGTDAEHPSVSLYLARSEIQEKIDQIHFCGRYAESEKEAVFTEMDVLVFPSICNESAPLAVREAMRIGTPVIASRCGDPEDSILDGVNGALLKRGDAKALAACIDVVSAEPLQIERWRQNISCTDFPHVSERAKALEKIYKALNKTDMKGSKLMENTNEAVLLRAEVEAYQEELKHRDTYIRTHIEVERVKNASLKQQLQLADQHIMNLEAIVHTFPGKIAQKYLAVKRKCFKGGEKA